MTFTKVFLILHGLLVLAQTLRILWRNDLSPVARLAWFIVVLVFPYFGVVAYWLFGEIDLGHKVSAERQRIIQGLQRATPEVLGNRDNIQQIPVEHQQAFDYASSVNDFATTVGNSATLMATAEDARKQMIADFDKATNHIHVLYYIWLNDETGINTAKALIRASERGVRCRAMADGLGSRAMIKSELWQQMKQAGVDVQVALPIHSLLKTLFFSRIDLRNHRKITIIDAKITYCGSQNCADPEFRVKPKYAPWIDIMLRFEGDVVAQNQMLFASDWLANSPDTPLSEFVYNVGDSVEKEGFPAQVFADGPTERQSATPQMLTTLIGQAQDTLTISTPYFVPDYSVLNALCATAYRGVRVIMIFPKRNDSFVVKATSQSYYEQMLMAGIEIYEFSGGLLHAKTLTIDEQVTMIGSTNMDLRSFDLNYENNILLYDPDTTQAVRERQQDYINSSEQVYIAEVRSWSIPKRIWHNVIATIGPLL